MASVFNNTFVCAGYMHFENFHIHILQIISTVTTNILFKWHFPQVALPSDERARPVFSTKGFQEFSQCKVQTDPCMKPSLPSHRNLTVNISMISYRQTQGTPCIINLVQSKNEAPVNKRKYTIQKKMKNSKGTNNEAKDTAFVYHVNIATVMAWLVAQFASGQPARIPGLFVTQPMPKQFALDIFKSK